MATFVLNKAAVISVQALGNTITPVLGDGLGETIQWIHHLSSGILAKRPVGISRENCPSYEEPTSGPSLVSRDNSHLYHMPCVN